MAGRKLTLALKHASEAAKETGSMMQVLQKMSDKQRRLFLEISKGKDELQALIAAGYNTDISGIAKKVYKIHPTTGKRIGRWVEWMTENDLEDLEDDSYQRLLNLARTKVQQMAGDFQYRDFMIDINDFFKVVAPEAFSVVAEIMGDKAVKADVRLKAAVVILDRAGYRESTPEQGNEMPVKLIMNFGMPTITSEPIEVTEEEMKEKNASR